MSTVQTSIVNPDTKNATNEAIGQGQPARSAEHKNYKGFIAGVFSGIAKLSGTIEPGNLYSRKLLIFSVSWASVRFLYSSVKPVIQMGLMCVSFDTIKVRLQTSEKVQFQGPSDCLLQTIRHEGVRGLYKGATPPLVGWMFMDSMYDQPLSTKNGSANEWNTEC